MESVPKIVQERLKAAAVTVDHPDPDVLTAFSESALPERERGRLLEHLAHCAECREIIALALPAEEPLEAVVHPVRGKWLTWPRLRWGLVAAGVIVVGSFGVLRYERATHPATVASFEPSRNDESARAKNQAEPLTTSRDDLEKKADGAPNSSVARKQTPNPEAKEFDSSKALGTLQGGSKNENALVVIGNTGARVRSPALPHGPKPPLQQWQQNMIANANNANAFQSQAPVPAAPPPFAHETANQLTAAPVPAPSTTGSNMGGPVSADKKVQSLDNVAANSRSVAPFSSAGANAGEVARAKPAEAQANAPQAQYAQDYAVSPAESSNFAPSGSLVPESSRWAINSVGGLQRSLDQGKTWQDVDVNSGSEVSGGVNLSLAMKSSPAKAAVKDKAASKTKSIVFRTVAANGPDVWAGGSEGNLYHSVDSGDHWMRIVPSWRGVQLTGDIINLQFADTQHGRIITSSAEIWTTADDGQTWDKQ
jgi:hypothetical protein